MTTRRPTDPQPTFVPTPDARYSPVSMPPTPDAQSWQHSAPATAPQFASSAPATTYPAGQEPVVPTVTLDLDSETVEAVFATDADANAFVNSLQTTQQRFIGVRTVDGRAKTIRLDRITSYEITGVALKPAAVPMASDALVALKGSALTGARYNGARRALTLDFDNGRRYVYEGVEQATFDALVKAPQPGVYFDAKIRGRFVEKDISG